MQLPSKSLERLCKMCYSESIMPHDKGNSPDSLVNQLKELDRKLDVSSNKPPAGIETQPVSTSPETPATPEVTSSEVAPSTPEQSAKETAFENYKQVNDENPEESPYVIKQAKPTKADIQQASVKSPQLQEIEDLMTKDLAEMYQRMSPEDQQKFKAKGEEVAQEIDSLLQRAKLTAKRVLHLIRSWLKLVPGINKFFLEQEAKIKAEELIHFARKHNNKI